MKIKTSDLIGPALDWAVAKCEDRDMYFDEAGEGPWFRDVGPDCNSTDYGDWPLCGPIIEREKIELQFEDEWCGRLPGVWSKTEDGFFYGYGPTPLIAAMRCYVALKLGDEIEIPEELK